MERARTDKLGNLGEAQVFGMMLTDELFCLGNHWRLGVLALDQDLVAQYRQVFGKNGKQLDRSRVPLARFPPKDWPGPQKANRSIPQPQRHNGLTRTGIANRGGGVLHGGIRDLRLQLQTSPAGPVFWRHQRAKWRFNPTVVKR